MKNKPQPMKPSTASRSKRVPKLRFPEFRDAPEWEVKKLINVADKEIKWSFIGGPFGSNLKASDYRNDGVRIIQLQNIGDTVFLNDYKIYTSERKADELLSCNIYPGDIILSKMGDPVARACVIPNHHPRYVMCSDGIRLAVDEKRYDKYFVYLYINSEVFRKRAERASTGSTRKRIALDALKQLPLNIPSFPEQQRIADCLSSLDEWIAAEAQRLDALKDHKKGLMRQLFPCEGETTPKLRFPEFQDAPEWEEKKLGSVFHLQDGFAFRSTDFVKQGETNTQVVRISDINNQNQNEDKVFIPNAFLDTINAERYRIKKGDMLLSLTGAAGFNFFLWDGPDAVINQRTAKITPKKEANKPLIRLLEPLAYSKINERGEGQNNNLSRDFLSNVLLQIPSSPEQQRIADCLSSLDELIRAQANRLDALRDHKKGLMQQLFPSGEEADV